MNSATFFACAILIATINLGDCACPNLPTVANLNKQAYTGRWYSILESSSPRLPCLHYNVEVAPDNNLKITFLPYNLAAGSTQTDPNDISKGFNVISSLGKINGAHLSVFATDYVNYAGIFVCKEDAKTNYHSVTLWSRTPFLSAEAYYAMTSVLSQYGVDYSTFQYIRQFPRTFCLATDLFLGTVTKTLIPLLM